MTRLFLTMVALVPSVGHSFLSRAGLPVARLRSADVRILTPSPRMAMDLEEVAAQWVNSAEKGLALSALKNVDFTEEIYTVEVSKEGGLGLVLAEMWANPNSQKGLVLVEEIASGSNAEKPGVIEVGDSIVEVKSPDGKFAEDVEGKDWETTVDALGSVNGPTVELMMKRLVPREKVTIKVKSPTGEDLGSFASPAGSNLRMEFIRRGLPKDQIYDSSTMRFDAVGNAGSNCGGEGSCGTCLVAVTKGYDLISEPGRIEGKALAKQDRPARWRWSCRMTVGEGNAGGEVDIQLQPQLAFPDEQRK